MLCKANWFIAETIAQSFQYASTSAVDAGFCAISATVSAPREKRMFLCIQEAPDIIQAGLCVEKCQKQNAPNFL